MAAGLRVGRGLKPYSSGNGLRGQGGGGRVRGEQERRGVGGDRHVLRATAEVAGHGDRAAAQAEPAGVLVPGRVHLFEVAVG